LPSRGDNSVYALFLHFAVTVVHVGMPRHQVMGEVNAVVNAAKRVCPYSQATLGNIDG
jgi:organic hydroperoxide reductase OsmC/OhrA